VPGFLPAVSLKSDAEQCLILSLRKLSVFDASSNQSHLNNKNRTYRYANKYFVNPKETFRYDKTYYILYYFVSWNIEWRSARFWLTGKEMSITNVLSGSKWSNLDARCDEIGNRKAKNVVHSWSPLQTRLSSPAIDNSHNVCLIIRCFSWHVYVIIYFYVVTLSNIWMTD